MRKIFFLLVFITAFGCNSTGVCKEEEQLVDNDTVNKISPELVERKMQADSINQVLKWKEIAVGLYVNKDGEIGIWSFRLLDPPDYGYVYYQTCFSDENQTPLNSVIDLKTFRLLAGGGFGAYYQDKGHVYHSFGTTGGSNFSVQDEADVNTFEILNDCYAKDKNHVYEMRFGLIKDADAKTFKVLDNDTEGEGCYAKDKNNYYRGSYVLQQNDLNTPEVKRVIDLLNTQ
ncbi:DKNYY domain-containing protein [Flavobacterium beibuense]|uniref:DKNYY domain-containing protein n=1 Tax=Flavobacterium beibuense TaxID=657326 RepID=UPI003A8D5E5A